MNTYRRFVVAAALALAIALVGVSVSGQSVVVGSQAKVDAVFAKWTAATPGCAVGVATGGTPVLTRGCGTINRVSTQGRRSVRLASVFGENDPIE